MKTNSLRSLIFFLFTISGLFAQTETEKQEIIANYDLTKLDQLEAEYSEKFNIEKQKAMDLAAIYGWPEYKDLPNGGVGLLVGVYANGNPKYYITNNREGGITTRANKVHTGGGAGLNLNGEDMILGVWDGGRVYNAHPLLQNRVTQIDNPSGYSNHSTHVSGTMIGTGTVQSGAAKGMAPIAEILAYDFGSDSPEMVAAAANGMLVSNHSYGTDIQYVDLWQLGYYDSNARAVDNITYNAPYYLSVWSAGNDRQSGVNTGDGGYDYLTDSGVAKNNIVVAAVYEVLNYTGPGSVNMSGFSSWGPTDDGRIKPDISAKGVNMYSSVGPSGYANYNGTSMSAPNTSGSLILLQQHYNDLNGDYMLASTLRGLTLHTADEAGNDPGPDYRFGWGLLNTERAAEVITNNGSSSVIIEEEIQSGEVYTYTLQSDGVNDLIASLAWTDPPADILPQGNEDDPSPRLVNDLDIRISVDGGSTYYPWKLDVNNFSAPATTGDNLVDNIEKTEISGASGEYIVQVLHKGTALTEGSQVFSLINSGIDREDFYVSSHEGIKEACTTDSSATFNIDLSFSDGFSDTINFSVSDLPAGTTGNISPASMNSEGTTVLTVSGIGSLSVGDYPIKVTATGSSESVNVYVTLRMLDDNVPDVGLIFPPDGAVDQPVVINFVWEQGNELVDNYDFELARDIDFNTIEFSENVVLPTVQILGVTEGAEYFWRVRPNTICNEGDFSDVFTFTVEGVLGIDDISIDGLKVFPIPANEQLNIVATNEISNIEIYNVLGQLLIEKTVSNNSTEVDLSFLESGNYFVKVFTESKSDVLQIVKY